MNEFIAVKTMNFGYSSSFKLVDKGLIEQLGPTGISSFVFSLSFNLLASQSGYIYNAILFFICGFGLFLFFYFLLAIGSILTVYSIKFLLLLFGFCALVLVTTI